MLSLKFGLWQSKNGFYSGSFTIFGRKFIAFLNKNEDKSGKKPDWTINIQESNDDTK
jgi:hypothetical protein